MLHTRLSKHFILFDFLSDIDVRNSPLENLSKIEANIDEYIKAGRYLCENLLEPLTERFGASSIAAGLCPDDASPHGWLGSKGMACDIAFHDWVNQDKPPFHLLTEIDNSSQRYERAISYAGSEFMCLSIRPNSNRRALYENVRIPDGVKPKFANYNSSRWLGIRKSGRFTPADRPDWRREENEPVYHTRRSIRPQHIRVGEYFTLLDLMRNADAFRQGEVIDQEIIHADLTPFRKVASVLDHAVRRIGRVSVYRGFIQIAGAGEYNWLIDERKRVQFLTGDDWTNSAEFIEHMMDHISLQYIDVSQHDGSWLIELVVS